MKSFLTAKEASDYLGVSEPELDRIVSNGKVPSYKIGGIYTRFKVDDLAVYRRKFADRTDKRHSSTITDSIKDFFYFNDFYIFSFIAITLIIYFIFK